MKRENKYRVWNESFTEFHINTLTELIGGMYYDDAVKSTFEQFTGLTDKNGVEICAGDIICIKHPYKSREHTGTLEYGGHKYFVKNFHFSHFDEPSDIFSEGTDYIEVVGNIHQEKN